MVNPKGEEPHFRWDRRRGLLFASRQRNGVRYYRIENGSDSLGESVAGCLNEHFGAYQLKKFRLAFLGSTLERRNGEKDRR